MDFIDFEIRGWQVDDVSVQILVHSSPVGDMRRPVTVHAPMDELRMLVAELRDAGWGSETARIRQILSAILLPEEVRDLLQRSLDCVSRKDGVRVRLCLDESLIDLPWELVAHAESTGVSSAARYLALDKRLSLVRGAPIAGQRMTTSRQSQRLAFAGALVGPSKDDDDYGVRREHTELAAVLAPVKDLITVDDFVDASADHIQTILAEPAMIFHYAGHANADEGAPGRLLKEFIADDATWLPVDQLLLMLQQAEPKLVVLSGCNTGRRAVVEPLLHLELGVAAVIGVQGLVMVESAVAFCGKLYETLALGLSLDEAVIAARWHLVTAAPATPGRPFDPEDWASFMVYMPTSEAVLFPKRKAAGIAARQKATRRERSQAPATLTLVRPTLDDREHVADAMATRAGRHYTDVVLELRDLDPARDRFVASVLPSPAVGESRPVNVPFAYGDLEHLLTQLEQKEISAEDLMVLGERLGDRLLPDGEVRDLFRAAMRKASRDGGVRVRLVIRDQRLAELPWEYAYLPEEGGQRDRSGFLALNPQISIVRHEPRAEQHLELTRTEAQQLRLVIAMADVRRASLAKVGDFDFSELSLESERKVVETALSDFAADGVTLDKERFLVSATANDLARALLRSADVFHFAGHGLFVEEAGGFILLQKDAGSHEGTALAADDLAALLQRAGVRVAILGACRTAQRSRGAAWAGVASALVRRGLPAAVAMQYDLDDEQGVEFSRMLYTALASGLTLDEAVSAGRDAMRRVEGGSEGEWGVPVLYMRSLSGVILPRLARRAPVASEENRYLIRQAR